MVTQVASNPHKRAAARVQHIRLQDGASLALKDTLPEDFAREVRGRRGTILARQMPGVVAPTPRIVYPGQHSILVLDPDMPPQHQRVFLTMRSPQAGLFWRLNGAPSVATRHAARRCAG